MGKRKTSAPAYQLIIRAIHSRGLEQEAAIRALWPRGLWLTGWQIAATGLEPDAYTAIYQPLGWQNPTVRE